MSGLIVPPTTRVSSGFHRFSSTSCGVSTSGGNTTPTCTPRGVSSARTDSISPPTANLAGPYAL
ncbi:hypothetical protein ACWD26_31905 [Streptomyces sp. NPDC002787]